MDKLIAFFERYTGEFYIPRTIRWEDIVEMAILSILVYHLIFWIKRTRTWTFLKGLFVIGFFALVAAVFQMTTIMWIVENVLSIVVIAVIIVLQPELRKALEQLGRKNLLKGLGVFEFHKGDVERFSDKTVNELVRACSEMSKVKTGALIVIEKEMSLTEYEKTGIELDAALSSQLLINIFEHNTPLHDGAIVVRKDRITYATCYLPLSTNLSLGKELGTRHRAGVGISEITDSFTIIVSEETGAISVVNDGIIKRELTVQQLREELIIVQGKSTVEKKNIWKGRSKSGKKIVE